MTVRSFSTLALIALLTLPTSAQTTRPAKRPLIRYTVRERVELLVGDQWHLATVLAWEKGQLRVRTDADNAEHLVQPIELRKYTRSPSYPIKAAAQDIAAIEAALAPPGPKPADPNNPNPTQPIRPGLQPLEPDPEPDSQLGTRNSELGTSSSPNPQSAIRNPQSLPLPPAPSALPKDTPIGDLSMATLLASPEKVAELSPYTPDPTPAPTRPLSSSPIPLRPIDRDNIAGFQIPAPLLFTSPEFSQAFVPHRETAPEADSDLYYDRIDLSTAQRTGGFAVPPGSRVLDLSPDGTRLLVSWTSDDSTLGVPNDTLGLFVITNDRLTLRSAWRPYAQARNEIVGTIASAHFVDNTHLLTSTGNDLTAWDLTNPKPRANYRLFPITPCPPALSPSRKYVAVVVGTTPWLLDSTTGLPALKLQATLPPGATGPLSLSPDSQHLACLLEDRLLVFQLGTRNSELGTKLGTGNSELGTLADVALPLPNPATKLDWLSPNYALINDRYCVDLKNQTLLWDYPTEDDGVAASFANELFYSTPSKLGPRVLTHTTLPHPPALTTSANINPETLMAIRPGMTVSIDLSQVDADPLFKSRAVAALTVKLQSNGLTVAENQPIRLLVTSTPGEEREITYRSPTTGDATTLEVPEDTVTVSFVDRNNTTLWKTTGPATPPGTLALRPNQTVEDYLAAERARLRLSTAAAVNIPKFIPTPRPTLTYGTSPLTDTGPEPAHEGKP